jgi:hypothetical protein
MPSTHLQTTNRIAASALLGNDERCRNGVPSKAMSVSILLPVLPLSSQYTYSHYQLSNRVLVLEVVIEGSNNDRGSGRIPSEGEEKRDCALVVKCAIVSVSARKIPSMHGVFVLASFSGLFSCNFPSLHAPNFQDSP